MANWREMINKELPEGEALVACTLSDEELNQSFDAGYGLAKGAPFTAWSETRVFFPVVYDGAEWVGSVPRNPCAEVCEHFGGQ